MKVLKIAFVLLLASCHEASPWSADPRPHVRVQCFNQDVVGEDGTVYEKISVTRPISPKEKTCVDGTGFSRNQVQQKGFANLKCNHPKHRLVAIVDKDGPENMIAECYCFPRPDVLILPVEEKYWCK